MYVFIHIYTYTYVYTYINIFIYMCSHVCMYIDVPPNKAPIAPISQCNCHGVRAIFFFAHTMKITCHHDNILQCESNARSTHFYIL